MKATPRQQRTIERAVQVTGFGYWSGKDVTIEFRPAEENDGVTFVRRDIQPHVRIPATVDNRIEMPRRTTLEAVCHRVEMVEHILAALSGLCIDNCEVWCDGPEMPGVDGSSLAFVEALADAGICEQSTRRTVIHVTDTVRVEHEQCWIEARPTVSPELTIENQLDYGTDGPIGRQSVKLPITPETFRDELASARTFLLKAEAEWLLAQGLGTRASYQDLLVFDDDGPIENELRYKNECVRHKTLDIVGDLSLAGADISGEIVAYRSSHKINAMLVKQLLASEANAPYTKKSA